MRVRLPRTSGAGSSRIRGEIGVKFSGGGEERSSHTPGSLARPAVTRTVDFASGLGIVIIILGADVRVRPVVVRAGRQVLWHRSCCLEHWVRCFALEISAFASPRPAVNQRPPASSCELVRSRAADPAPRA
jgi:hypothetical protein